MIDPRVSVIEERLKNIKRIIPVVSGKGGVGKSLISTTMALLLKDEGYNVGLLDLDFHGASDHIILNADITELPPENKGIVPPSVNGIKFMSIVYYSRDKPIPLRGDEITDALIEILAITRWDSLDFLLIDMPPGMGDQLLDLIRFLRRGEFIVVGTPSPLAVTVVSKLIELLKEQKVKILGIVENMVKNKILLRRTAEKYETRYLGAIAFDEEIDNLIGKEDIITSRFAVDLKNIVRKL